MMKEPITEPSLVTVESRPEMKVHPRQGSFLELFALQAKMRGTATAVQCGSEALSYQELDRRSNQLAHHLRRLGVGPEVRVGVWLPRSMELVVALFGIIKAGGAYVPLDMNYPQERVNDMLADSQSSLLLALESTRAHLRKFAGRTVLLDTESGQITNESEESPAVAIDPENLAYLIYTSGSTGRPKAVAIRHHSVSTLLSWIRKIFTDEELDGMVASTSICFDVSVFEIFGTLSWGGRAILVNNALDIPALKPTDRASLINVVPSAMAELLRAGDIPQSVKTVNLPGEPLSGALVKQVYQRKHVERAYNLYGPSEDTTFSTYELVRRDEAASIVPVGFPITNTELYILNDEMQPASASEAGDVYIGGDGLARGYLNRPDLTAERFVPDGVSGRPGSRLYYTGDRGHFLPDGRLEYLGRVDHQVKIRGFRVELGEIEAVLNAHPQVEQAVVLARESMPDQKKLIAYVVADSGKTVAGGELRSYLQQKLPDYMVPAQFMFLEQLPLTPNGKVNRHALPMPENTGSGAAPRTELGKTLVRALCEVLELPDVSLESTFLELGGSSLNATRAVAAIYEATSLRLPLASLFEKTLLEIEQELQGQMNRVQSEALQPRRRPAGAAPVPAAYSQERIWFIQRMDPLATAYHFSARIRFIGRLNRAALEFALSKFLERHEIYRTTLSEVGGNLFQIVHDPWKVVLEDINVEDDPAQAARVFSQMHEPFDLTSLPLVRWKLLRLSSNEHALLVVEHHVIHDGWSFNVFMGELTELYRSYDMGVSPRLDPSPFQFRDFAQWQREWMETHEARKQLDYWTKALAGIPPLLLLPYDHPRPAIQTYAGDVLRLQISDDLENQFPAAGRRNRVTVFMLFTAAMAVLLHRYSRQEDFCLGTGIANRRWTETKDLTGMLVNNIPLRMKITGDLTVAELLEQVRRTTLEAYACQDVPFDKIVQATNPVRHPSYNPIFQVMLGFHDSPLNCASLGDTHLIVDQALANGSSKFDLNVVMVPPQNHNLPPGYKPYRELLWEYNSSLFSRTTAQQMAAHFLHVLEGIVRDGLQTVSAIALLTEAEQQQILTVWNQTSRPYPAQCVHQLFEEQAEKTPAATATIYGRQQLTYAEVNRQANQLAHYLRKRGAGPESLIGIFMERSPQMIVALLAVLKAGAAYVPLDLTYPPERLCFMIKDAGLKIVLAGQELGADITGGQSGLQSIHLETERPRITAESAANPGCLLDHTSLAYVMYTSGSTGTPKGIAIEHRNIVRLVRETDYVNLGPTDRIAQVANVSFDAATFEIWGALLNGGYVVGIDKHVVLNPSELGRKIREENITAMFLTTALFNQIAREVKGAFAGVRYLFVGGEAVDPQHARLVLQDGPPRQLTNAYGPTEATTFSTWFVIEKVEESTSTVPIGRPLTNAQTYVLDEYLQPVPLGVTGELFIGGMGVGRGYLNRPELTAEKFMPHPFTNRPGERLYRTGDLVRQLRDGNLEFVGRIDHQIKIRGFRVELDEIEAVLAQFRGVKQCVVLLREDQPGEKKLVAYLVPDDGLLLDLAAVRAYLKTRLPDYMVPSACLDMPSLPLTANGKIDRQALPAPHYQRRTYCAPRTPQEEILCEIFSDVLAVPRVGIDDNFFDLGGHSLMATRLVSRVRSLLNAEVPLGVFFESPTVVGLAEHLRGAEKARLALVRQERPERVPLSYAQQRLWFLDQLQGSSTEYNIVEALRLRGELDRKALEQALSTIVERHEVLRTHFVEMEGRPVQVIAERLPVRVMVEDLRGLGEAGQRQRLEAAMWQEREQPFDLGRGPLFRMRLLQVGEQEHVLLRTFHHIVSDGWSQGVFNGELTRLYEAFHKGEENPLEPLGIQYADFALWQRRWLEEGELARELEYWKRQLQGISGQLELPRDHGRPGRQTFRAEVRRRVLGEEEVVEVKRAGQAGRATLYMTLLAGFGVLLGRYSGEEDLVVGTPIANRQEAQLEKMLGFFVNTLVLRMRVREEESFAELLGQVRETALEAYAHQDLPFERLVEELAPQRSLNTTPIYQVLFALQNAPVEMHKLTGLEVERIRGKRLTVRFDLELHAVEQDGEIELNWIYNPDLFERWRIEQMGRHYETLLKAATKEPGLAIGSLEMLTVEERQQILTEWNRSELESPAETTIHGFFEQQARRTPFRRAVADRQRTFNYADLNRRADQFACHLRKLGVRPEVKVGLCMERSLDMIAALLGILKAGGAYVPLDPEYPPDRLGFMLEDSQATVLFTDQDSLPDLLPSFPGTILSLEQIQDSESIETSGVPTVPSPENIAYVIYTSGSTGTPKGVAIRHSSAVALLHWAQQTFSEAELTGVLGSTSLCFDLSVYEIFLPLSCGGTVMVVRNALEITENAVPEWLTLINTVPSAMRELLRLKAVPASVRTVNLAGEPLPAELVREIFQLSHVKRVFNLYGPSEATTYSTFVCLERTQNREKVPIGKPVSNTRAYVLDRRMEPVPVGVAGELYLGGAGLAREYLNRPELTAERFVPDPFAAAAGERLYRTGDRVCWGPDGALEFLGRMDHQLKIRGFRIEPGEVEAVLKRHAGVQDALAVAREDSAGNKQLIGYVVPAEGAAVEPAELRERLRKILPDHMVPAAIVVLAAWPLTPNGKIDRTCLPEPGQQSEGYRAPKTPEEEILCRLFAEVLGLEQVGADDNFFNLGGHSLLATLLVSRIRAALGINLAVHAIFETPTVAGVAPAVASARQLVQQAAYAHPSAVKRA